MRANCILFAIKVGATTARERTVVDLCVFRRRYAQTLAKTLQANQSTDEQKINNAQQIQAVLACRGAAEINWKGATIGTQDNGAAHNAGCGGAAKRETVEQRTKERKRAGTMARIKTQSRAHTQAVANVSICSLSIKVLYCCCVCGIDDGGGHIGGGGPFCTVFKH